MNYADIILPQATDSYTYSIPDHLKGLVVIGMRVEVPLGARVVVGIVRRINDISLSANSSKIKSIRSIVEPIGEPLIIAPWYIESLEWMAQYYMVPIGEVYRALVPSFFRKGLTGRSRVWAISPTQAVVPYYIDILRCSESIDSQTIDDSNYNWRTELKRSKGQLNAIDRLIDIYLSNHISCHHEQQNSLHLINSAQENAKEYDEGVNTDLIFPYISKSYIINKLGISTSILNKLKKRGLIEYTEVLANQLADHNLDHNLSKEIDMDQKSHGHNIEIITNKFDCTTQTISNSIATGLKNNIHHIGLLIEKGYNTEIKSKLLANLIREQKIHGKLTIILTPDTLTSQWMTSQLNNLLNNDGGSEYRIATFSSRHTESARRAIFYGACDGEYDLIIGTRGLLFQPYDKDRLGMIIVDQEENFAYKNSDSAPRYNAKDVGVMVGKWCSAKVLLMSQAPSLESYAMARGGKWDYQEIDYRTINNTSNDCLSTYDTHSMVDNSSIESDNKNTKTPLFKIIDRGKGLLSSYLLRRIKETIDAGKQVIIFQNRRGYAGYTECQECFFTPSCPHCSVSLTYHMSTNSMQCHYCGFNTMPITKCPTCGSNAIKQSGIGTQRLEQDLSNYFTDLNIARLDTDNAQKKGALEEITYDFASQNSDIMVGTQLMLNGLDFSNVALICIANADSMLMNNDFRASERAFSLLTQLSNRLSHSTTTDAEIIIQTSKQNNPIIINALKGDLDKFYAQELEQRQRLNYPPAVRMMTIVMSSESLVSLNTAVQRCDKLLRPIFGNRLSPSYEPSVARIANKHYIHQMLRIERSKSINKAKAILNTAISTLRQEIKDVRVYVDVDPI